ncbi:MAG: flippase-like domain-containing protein [Chloroflexi bacterium]|nr:flippase-like domain-containing protein [Chloroflexota bacterium]
MKPKGWFAFLPETQTGEPSARFRLMMSLAVVLAAFFLYLAFRDLDWQAFFLALKKVQYAYLPFVLAWSSLTFFIRALRLRILLPTSQPMGARGVFWANMAGYLGNIVLPARAGELVRAAYLARIKFAAMSFALAAGLVERLMDLLALILLGGFSLSFAGITSPQFQSALNAISIFAALGLAVVFILPQFEKKIRQWIPSLPLLNENQKSKLTVFLAQFFDGLKSLRGLKRAVSFIALTGIIWLMDAAGTVILARILNIPLLIHQAFVLLAALGLSSAIPSTPGYVGVYQFAAVAALTPFGISKADALAFILISQILAYLVIGFWGVLSLWRLKTAAV